MKAFVSWSGGKETSLACHKAMQDENLKVRLERDSARERCRRAAAARRVRRVATNNPAVPANCNHRAAMRVIRYRSNYE